MSYPTLTTMTNNFNGSFGSDKDRDYYSHIREDIIDLLPNGANRVLEIGCGFGNTLIAAKKRGKAMEIVGVDITQLTVSSELDQFIAGDIENTTLGFPQEYFDAIYSRRCA